jgi:drug/metabolite transporter (DMT)-like permease
MILAILLSAALQALWNVVLKLRAERSTLQSILLPTCFIGVPCSLYFTDIGPEALPYLLIASIFHIIARFSSYYLVVLMPLSGFYPLVRGAIPTVVTFASIFLLGERVSDVTLLAIFCIVCGVSINASLDKHTIGAPWHWLLMLVMVVSSSAYILLDGVGIRQSHSEIAFISWVLTIEAVASFLITIVMNSRTGSPLISINLMGSVGGIFQILSSGIAIYTLSLAPLAVIAALRETSIIFVIYFSYVFLKEPIGKVKILATLVILIGILLLKGFS